MIVEGDLYRLDDQLILALEKIGSSRRVFIFNWNEIGVWGESFILRHYRRLDND